MLTFNLTGLKSSEEILQSKFYMLNRPKRKPKKKKDHSSFRLNIGCLPNMTSLHHIDISLTRPKPEWQSYDISEAVVACRQTSKSQDGLLGLTLEVKRSRGRHRLVSFKRIMKKNAQPFVLIFSEDSQNQSNIASNPKHDEFRDLIRLKANQESLNRPPKPSQEQRHRGKRTTAVNALEVKNSNQNFVTNYLRETTKRFNGVAPSILVEVLRTALENIKRGSFANEHHTNAQELLRSIRQRQPATNYTFKHAFSNLFQNANDVSTKKVLELAGEQDLSRTSETIREKRSLADTLVYSTDKMESHEIKATVQTIAVIREKSTQNGDLQAELQSKNRKMHKNRRRKKKKKGKNRKIPFWWTKHDNRLLAEDTKQTCRRKSLTVDFSQIGWDDWIISPKSFNAHYCEGGCTFQNIKHTDTSNHAAVQSLVRAMQLNNDIPLPSCVPSLTNSLTLLYFDEHGNLVLKSYPNMIVDKCGCR